MNTRFFLKTIRENTWPSMRAMTFAGRVSKQNTIHGAIKGLSLHAPSEEKYHGSYSEQQMGKNYKAEQIILLPSVPQASVLSLSRVQGACQ
ncbi:hypothetical protein [Limnohabitans sp.]|jgi:hypothetical protein|uniref:hypothetical protein n=1 Tax=Limnohabitans sp. TaxID=1907725 RepID=UPI0037BEF504